MIEVRELIDAELDGVCGGFFDVSSVVNKIIVDTKNASQVGAAVGGSTLFGNGGAASLVQAIAQTSTNVIG
jgi:hypothetical protein